MTDLTNQRARPLSRLALVLLLAMPAAGCMLQPIDGAIAVPTDTLEFGGYDTEPGSTLRIWNYQFGSWYEVGSTTSSTTAMPYDGTDLYSWSARLSLARSISSGRMMVPRVRNPSANKISRMAPMPISA